MAPWRRAAPKAMAERTVDEDTLLDLINRIYGAGLDPETSPDTLARLSALAGAVCTDFYIIQDDDVIFATHGGIPRQAIEHYLARYHGRTKRSILLPRVPQGTLLTDLDLMSRDEMAREPFYQEFLRRWDACHFLGMSAVNTSSLSAAGGIQMPIKTGPPNRSVYALAKVILPHIRRAVLMQTRLAGARLHERRLVDCIDTLAPGVILLDMWGKVCFSNAAARDIFATSGALGVRRGRLVAADRLEGRRLERLVASALSPAPSQAPAGGIMDINGHARRRPLSVLVSPVLAERRGWDGVAAIVFISDPERKPETPEHLLMRLYGLTPAEARLAQRLVAGEHLNEIVERLGIVKETARGQLRPCLPRPGHTGRRIWCAFCSIFRSGRDKAN